MNNTISADKLNGAHMIAHRGYSAIAPENTLPAFKLAGENGFWGAECDTSPTADGVWIVMHDDTVDRTTNGEGPVNRFTFDEIRALTIDGGHNPEKYPEANVPLLILFILLAIPVCLLLIGLLLALAAACVGLAAGLLFTGFNGLTAAFTSFSVFADILLVFGAALVLSAVGLLFFWLFLRLLFSAIPGVVRGALALGRKWCYKEVAQV